jgi:hypothetical protein
MDYANKLGLTKLEKNRFETIKLLTLNLNFDTND